MILGQMFGAGLQTPPKPPTEGLPGNSQRPSVEPVGLGRVARKSSLSSPAKALVGIAPQPAGREKIPAAAQAALA
jgi:hypothetical protein